jgi:hypothetical protein
MKKMKRPPKCDFSNPEDVLRTFMCEMNEWETRARKEVDRHAGSHWDPTKDMRAFWEELAAIFDRYCTPVDTRKGKERERRRGRVQYRSVGMVPTYDLDRETVLETTRRPRKQVEIHTRRTGLSPFPRDDEFLYTLVETEAGWRIQRKRMHDAKGRPMVDYL